MALAPGTRLGVYEITAQIGEGGMGAVYRATDTSLSRQVAIKVLPDAFAADPDRLARFEREAKTLASLNHPHIAAIYGLEKGRVGQDGRDGQVGPFLVMELVEGDDLSQRIARLRAPGASARQAGMPLDEALPIAKQIAEALEAAHEQGIIHRDLKPANIKVRSDGTVKVLDFGLAKAMEPSSALRASAGQAPDGTPSMSMSPTITTPAMTQAGMILGTAAYMSPEQAKGRPVDRRTDIWAFGCVLFEMLTGTRAFAGSDVQETFVAIMRDEPNWAQLPSTVSPALGTYLKRCLQKDAKQRVQSIGDVRLALEGAFDSTGPQTTAATSSASGGRLGWIAFAVAALGLVALAVPAIRYLRETPPPAPPETRTELVTPATTQPTDFALSPDGRQIAFVASMDGVQRLWLRPLATGIAQALVGTEGARLPFWSPDSHSIGFFAGGALKRLDIGGGTPQTLATRLLGGRGGTWTSDGVIVFAPGGVGPLMRVSARGGPVTSVTTLGPGQQSHRQPQILPDGRRLLFYAQGTQDVAGVYLGTLEGAIAIRITSADGNGAYRPDATGDPRRGGRLVWVRAGTLFAQPLDLERAVLTDEPVTLADGVGVDVQVNRSAFSVATSGLIAYRAGGSGLRQLTWMDRSGTGRGTVGDPNGDGQTGVCVSPDGRRVVVARTVQGNADLWLLDGARTSRLTFDTAIENYPVCSPDGTSVAFRSNRTGAYDLYQKVVNGSGVEDLIFPSVQTKNATGWSPDGRFLLYASLDPQTGTDLWALPMTGEHVPSVFLKTPFAERFGVFSPDGRWVAYHSDESGRNEIYVRPFAPPGSLASAVGATAGQWQVSTAGGAFAAWRPDGKELFYLDPVGRMMAAPITATGKTFLTGDPVALFATHVFGGGEDAGPARQYDVTRDGRFLINALVDGPATPITLIQHWNPDAKK